MSKKRQAGARRSRGAAPRRLPPLRRVPAGGRDPDLLVRSYAVTHPAGSVFPPHEFAWAQLAYAITGVMTVVTSQGSWVVPPHRAVWIPAGVTHRMEMAGRVAMRTLYFAPRFGGGGRRRLPARCRAVSVSPLLRELVVEAARIGVLQRSVPAQARLARVILDQLVTMEVAPLQLPRPDDERAREAADAIVRDPSGADVERAASAAGVSRRTLERLFKEQTGMTLGRWRQRARLIAALRRLAAGEAVTQVALEVGYESPSAFIYAFRRQLGTTPARYFTPEGSVG